MKTWIWATCVVWIAFALFIFFLMVAQSRAAQVAPGAAVPGAVLRVDLPEESRVMVEVGAFMWSMSATLDGVVLIDGGYGDVPLWRWDRKIVIMDELPPAGKEAVPLWDRCVAASGAGAVAVVVVSNKPGPVVGGLMLFGNAPILTIRVSVQSGANLRAYNFRVARIDVDPNAMQPPTKVMVKRR